MTNKSFLLLGIVSLAFAAACSPSPQAPEPTPLHEANVAFAKDVANFPAQVEKVIADSDREYHAVVRAAPADYKSRPCVYIARFNTVATYDKDGKFGNGSGYDGGAFAKLGEVGPFTKVAGPNYRKESVEHSPLAATEPEVVELYILTDALSKDPAKTDYADGGNATPTGECKA